MKANPVEANRPDSGTYSFPGNIHVKEDLGFQSRLIEICIDERTGRRKIMAQGNRALEKRCVYDPIKMISSARKKEVIRALLKSSQYFFQRSFRSTARNASAPAAVASPLER